MILRIFLLWRLGLLTVAYLGSMTFPHVANGALGAVSASQPFNFWLSWAQWDGGHYFQIAKLGYIDLQDYAFFPLFPFLVSKLSILLAGNIILSGLLIANVSFFLFLVVFFNLLQKRFGREVAFKSLITFLLFPTTFFAVSFYSESLFLLLSSLALTFLYAKRWLLAASIISLAGLTRVSGVYLIISLFYSYFSSNKFNLKKINGQILSLSLTGFGITIWSLYLFAKLNDPFKYISAQSFWQRSASDPLTTIAGYLWAILVQVARPFNDYIDLTITLIFVGTLIAGIKKIPSSLWIFSMLVILIPASTGTLTSMPRYALASLGTFVIFGKILTDHPLLKIPLWAILLIGQCLLLVRFINGYWVA